MDKVVVWDIDEVLAQLGQRFCEAFHTVKGIQPKPLKDWTTYRYDEHLNCEFNGTEVLDFMYHERLAETCLPFNEARDALLHVVKQGGTNVLLSARAWHPDGLAATRQWLKDHNMISLVADIYLVSPSETKTTGLRQITKEYSRISLFVEDHLGHASDAIRQDLVDRVALVDKPWNQVPYKELPAGVKRVRHAYHAAQLL